MGTGWEGGGTYHTAPAVPAGKAVTLFQQLDDVKLVVVASDVGLVQGAGAVLMHLGPEGRGGQDRLGCPWVGQGTCPHMDRGLTGTGVRLHWGHQRRLCQGRLEEVMVLPWGTPSEEM